MALRTFRDHEGGQWNAWFVQPSTGEASPLNSRYRDGWLCFQRTTGEERCRLPFAEVPAGWETLSDDRLDLLRRVAERPATVRAQVGPTEERRQASAEEEEKPALPREDPISDKSTAAEA